MTGNLISHQTRIRRAILSIEWILILAGIILGILIPYFLRQIQADEISDFFDNLVPEAVGIFFTVVFLERLNARREARVIREQLVRRVHSRHNQTALTAIEELRVLGELEKGVLAGLELRGSNWADANLYQADLRNCDLRRVRFDKADLVGANLMGANVSDEQLAASDIMYGAIMPNGKRYDGRYRLAGDYAYAEREGINTSSPEELAPWYGIPVEEFIEGQGWANSYLHTFSNRAISYDFNDLNNPSYGDTSPLPPR